MSRFGFGQLQRVRLPRRGLATVESEADGCAGGRNDPEALQNACSLLRVWRFGVWFLPNPQALPCFDFPTGK